MSKVGQETPQGQPQDVIGGGIDGSIVKQLIAREKLVSTAKKDKNQLLFFNGNGAWARLVSSINTITKEETQDLATGKKTIKEVTGNKSLAYNNVLMGGVLKQGTPQQPTSLGGGVNESKHNPINIDFDGFATAGDMKNSAYHKYESLGFRPTPGINSVSVKSKGTYGSLREAEVNVTVWTLEDLEMMQALYLRPGFTILLEWGHSLQLDSETGTINKDIQFYRKFLTGKVPRDTVQQDLTDIAFDSDYNYDAMVGFVSNFNWSFREDGGYDCVIKIISSGTVLESIAVTFDTSNVYPPDQLDTWSNDKGKKERRSIYHKLFVELEHLVGNPGEGFQAVVQETGEFIDATVDVTQAAQIALQTGNVDPLVSASAVAAEEFTEIFTGDDEDAFERLQSVQTTNGRTLLADPTFKAKYDTVLNGGRHSYRSKTYTWTRENPIAQHPEAPVVDYLTKQFSIYGLTFQEATIGQNEVRIKVNGTDREKVFDLNCFTAQGSRAETYDIMDYIVENGKLPGR